MARSCSAGSATETPYGVVTREIALSAAAQRQLAYTQPAHYPVLFDSAAAGALGRYTILAAFPQATIWLDAQRRLHSTGTRAASGLFLTALDAWWREQAQPPLEPAPGVPFRGGWVVFLGYEVAGEIEPQLALPAGTAAVGAFALRVPAALIHDRLEQRSYALAESAHAGLLDRIAADIAALPEPSLQVAPLRIQSVQEEEPQYFRERVQRALDYIRAGDIYQANLSRPWQIELAPGATAAAVYERLRAANPAPFAAWARFEALTLLSSSPERLVRVQGRSVETRPIAGTRARSGAPGGDGEETAALMANPKERAEHVMLIDLERNDLGRICRAGSVRADEFMLTESYAHVHHIVSNVCGELREQITPVDVLRAVFPGGTITGCPKYRCMQIISELEQQPRNAYTGALGYINHDGSMDFNILIRTLTQSDNVLQFRAGAGIVADSDWQRELQETRAKARGLLAAVGALE